jgi:hypothetical protein
MEQSGAVQPTRPIHNELDSFGYVVMGHSMCLADHLSGLSRASEAAMWSAGGSLAFMVGALLCAVGVISATITNDPGGYLHSEHGGW